MAIDTEEKRRATLGVWGANRILPVPDPGIDKPEREAVWLYPGIEVAGGGGGPAPSGPMHAKRGGWHRRRKGG